MKTTPGQRWERLMGDALLVAYEVLGHDWETSSERRRRLGACLARVAVLAAQVPPLVVWELVDPELQPCPICEEVGTLQKHGALYKCARCATLTHATAKVAVVKKTNRAGVKGSKKRRRGQ